MGRRRKMGRGLLGLVTACLAAAALAEPEFADSAPLTTMWQAISVGNTDQLIDVLVQAHEYGQQRAADGRGPLFWAYEFKCADALALLTHVGADEEAEDLDGKRPREFFPEGFGKVSDLSELLAQREEDFAAFQPPSLSDEGGSVGADDDKGTLDEIDYADDEEDEEDTKDEM